MWFKKFFNFFLFSSIFIALCAVALCMETNILLGLPFNNFSFYCFVFGATLLQYNLHYVSKTVAVKDSLRFEWSQRNKGIHIVLLIAGFLLIIFSLFSFRLQHFFVLIILGAIAFLYSFPILPFGRKKRIKEYGILKITTLALLWTLVSVWFPANAMPYDTILFSFVFVKRFVFMLILCLLFDVRDYQVDFEKNIRTFPVILGIKNAYSFAYLLLILLSLLSLFQFWYLKQPGFLIAMVISILATAFTIRYTKKNNSDIVFLAGIDGMMLLQAALIFLFSLNL